MDYKSIGAGLARRRRSLDMTQEQFAEQLGVTVQAISKWENGHGLPEATKLPVLADKFDCSIDELFLRKGKKEYFALSDEEIIEHFIRFDPSAQGAVIERGKFGKPGRISTQPLSIHTERGVDYRLKLQQYPKDHREYLAYSLLKGNTSAIAHIFYIDEQKNILLSEDLSGYINGHCFNDDTEDGITYKLNSYELVEGVAKLHAGLWENNDAFMRTGLDWRLENNETLLAHIKGMEKDYLKFLKSAEEGKLPKIGIGKLDFTPAHMNCFGEAVEKLRSDYPSFIQQRIHCGKSITIIHGDMHPGTTYLPREKVTDSNPVKFASFGALRVGYGAEDLAMLLALHIAPSSSQAKCLLAKYHKALLSEKISGYTYEMLLEDYKFAVMEALFFPVHLINRGIYDYNMLHRALKAYEDFVRAEDC